MNRLFYIFSKSKKLESVYLCENGNYVDKPLLKTGVYPMGTLLSKAIGLLTPWYEERLNLLKKDEIISAALKTSPKFESSFSYISNEDSVVRIVFETLIKNQEYLSTGGHYDKDNKMLEKFLDYIKERQENINESTTEKLSIKFNELGYIPPKYNLYYTDKQNEESANKQRSNRKAFNPDTIRQSKRLFDLTEPQLGIDSFGDLLLPIYVYEIHDIVDFIASALQCVFEENYILGKCHFCFSLFVAKDSRVKFCPNQLGTAKSCQERNKLKKQQIRENSSESKRVNKSIRTQLSNKLGTDDERYKYFLSKSKEYRKNIFNEKISEEEYISWMKQYWDDVKAEEREKKRTKK